MDIKTKRKWIAAAFVGAACAGLLVGLLLQRNSYVNREQQCEKLYAKAGKFFREKKPEDASLALSVLFSSFPSCENAPEAGYMLGVVKEFYTRETQKAVEIFKTVSGRYADTPAAQKAREKTAVYATDDFAWYKALVREKKPAFLEKNDAEQMREFYDVYGDGLEHAIQQIEFLQEGAYALNETKKKNGYAYAKAVLLKAAGNEKESRRIFSRLADEEKDGRLKQKALLHLADLSYRKKAYKSALDTLSAVTDVNLVPFADYGRGEIYFAQNDIKNASEFYRRAQSSSLFLMDDVLLFPFEPDAADYPVPAWFSGMDAALRAFQCDFLAYKKGTAQSEFPLPVIKMTLEKEHTKTRGNFLYRKQALYAYLLGASNEKRFKFNDALKNYAFILQKGKPVQDPDAVFPEVLFSAGRLYFWQKNYGKAQQLLTQFEENYPEHANITDAKAYRLLSLYKSGKRGGIPEDAFDSLIEKAGDAPLGFALYYAGVQLKQQAQKNEFPSVRDLSEETQAKRFYESVAKKALLLPVKPAELLVMLGDISFYAGDGKKAMTYFKDALQRKNAAGVKQGFESVQTFSDKPETIAAYLKKCVQREKARALEKKIEARDSAALRADLSRAYSELGWSESAFSQWRQAALIDLQTIAPGYLENMKTLVTGIMEDVDALFSESTFLSEGAELEAETAKPFREKLLYDELLLRTGLEARFPLRRDELEKAAGAPVSEALWNDFLDEKRFYIPASEPLKSLQENFADMLRSFRENETVTGELLSELKSQCEDMLSRIQEEKEE